MSGRKQLTHNAAMSAVHGTWETLQKRWHVHVHTWGSRPHPRLRSCPAWFKSSWAALGRLPRRERKQLHPPQRFPEKMNWDDTGGWLDQEWRRYDNGNDADSEGDSPSPYSSRKSQLPAPLPREYSAQTTRPQGEDPGLSSAHISRAWPAPAPRHSAHGQRAPRLTSLM